MISFLCTCFIDFFTKDQWITIIVTLIGLFGSVGIAYWIFNREINEKKKEEEVLSINEVKLLKDSLKQLTIPIDRQIKNLNDSINNNTLSFLKINLDVNSNFLKFVNLNRIYHAEIDNIQVVNKIVLLLSKIDSINDNLERETKSFVDRNYKFDNDFKSQTRELNLKYSNIEQKFIVNQKQATILGRSLEYDYQSKVIQIVQKLESNPQKFKKGLELKRFYVENCANELYELSNNYNLKDAKEIGMISLGIISIFRDLEDFEKSHISSLKRYIQILTESKKLFNIYTK